MIKSLDEIGAELVCIKYNTGDMIWLYRNEGALVVIKIIDDSGTEYRYDDSGKLLLKKKHVDS